MRRRRSLRGLGVALGLVVVTTGLVVVAWPSITTTLTGVAKTGPIVGVGNTAKIGNTLMVSPAADIADARWSLDRLSVVTRPVMAQDYRRAAFGEAWKDVDGNGCNQRDDVLFRDVVKSAPFTAAQQHACSHDMVAGTWVDPYTGASITLTDAKQQAQAQSVQIDHIVALSVAWRYGANAWSDAKRQQFANDLANLAAVGGAANQGKGGDDAAAWRPIRAAQCGYAVRYVRVKAAYALPVDLSEKSALTALLATCP